MNLKTTKSDRENDVRCVIILSRTSGNCKWGSWLLSFNTYRVSENIHMNSELVLQQPGLLLTFSKEICIQKCSARPICHFTITLVTKTVCTAASCLPLKSDSAWRIHYVRLLLLFVEVTVESSHTGDTGRRWRDSLPNKCLIYLLSVKWKVAIMIILQCRVVAVEPTAMVVVPMLKTWTVDVTNFFK